jgi:hypothetical protein
MRSVAGSLREVQEALHADHWRERFPTLYKAIGPHTHRAWTAAALGSAVFSVAFWVFALLGQGTYPVPEGDAAGDGTAFAPTVAVLYFALTLVAGPLFVHTLGRWLDRWAERFKFEDSVVVFLGVGVALAAVPVAIATLAGPGLHAFLASLFLFGLPIVLATGLARAYLPRVLRSPRATNVVFGIAALPPVVVLLFLLGLYVAQGSEG